MNYSLEGYNLHLITTCDQVTSTPPSNMSVLCNSSNPLPLQTILKTHHSLLLPLLPFPCHGPVSSSTTIANIFNPPHRTPTSMHSPKAVPMSPTTTIPIMTTPYNNHSKKYWYRPFSEVTSKLEICTTKMVESRHSDSSRGFPHTQPPPLHQSTRSTPQPNST